MPMPTYLRHRSRTRTRSGPALKPTRPEPRRAAPATRARRPVYYDRVTDGIERASEPAGRRMQLPLPPSASSEKAGRRPAGAGSRWLGGAGRSKIWSS